MMMNKLDVYHIYIKGNARSYFCPIEIITNSSLNAIKELINQLNDNDNVLEFKIFNCNTTPMLVIDSICNDTNIIIEFKLNIIDGLWGLDEYKKISKF